MEIKEVIKLVRSNPALQTVEFEIFGSIVCSTQKLNKSKKDEFVNWWANLKHIFMQEIFKLTYNKSMSTIHSAKIRRRWSTNWATSSTSNCEKRILEYNVPIVYLIGHKDFLYCTCGLCLNNTEEVPKLNQERFDALSISNWIIKKKSVHGARHGKSEEQVYYHQSFNIWKRCRTKTDEAGDFYTGILDRFPEDARYREAQQGWGWTEAKCKEMDALAQEDHTFLAAKEELER